MTPFISKILSRDCITVQHDETLRSVATTLKNNKIGAVPVLDGSGALVGILSERDLVQSLPQKIDLDTHLAADLMTTDLIVTSPEVSSSDLMKLMTDHKIRHIPIISEDGFLGIVSIGDVVKRLLEKLEQETEQLRMFINS
ncbi:CBS-domain-containing membrane protein [SAR116 cluster alpha proteobacterium HIMB100]|nr:CBS-domain-containing membrane protein [SAR116 cluster alpha proteobacterium HIMB100]